MTLVGKNYLNDGAGSFPGRPAKFGGNQVLSASSSIYAAIRVVGKRKSPFSMSDVREAYPQFDGYSISKALTDLYKRDLIKRTDRGLYRLQGEV